MMRQHVMGTRPEPRSETQSDAGRKARKGRKGGGRAVPGVGTWGRHDSRLDPVGPDPRNGPDVEDAFQSCLAGALDFKLAADPKS